MEKKKTPKKITLLNDEEKKNCFYGLCYGFSFVQEHEPKEQE